MSKPSAKKGLGRTLSRPSQIAEETSSGRITPTINKTDLEVKDDSPMDADKPESKIVDDVPQVKPQSAGTIVRDAGQKLLGLAVKQEWSSVEPVLKVLEKTLANSENPIPPLVGVMELVSIQYGSIAYSHRKCTVMWPIFIGHKQFGSEMNSSQLSSKSSSVTLYLFQRLQA